MPVNIEIKARVADFESLRARVESIRDGDELSPSVVLHQEDIFFEVPDGRLKLRIMAEDQGELIAYQRADAAGPKASHYLIAPTPSPRVMKTILTSVLPTLGTVRKERLLFHLGQTRIHLDRVDGLGTFLELEVVLRDGQAEHEGLAIAESLMNRLGIARQQLVEHAYIDLLEEKEKEKGLAPGGLSGPP